MVGFWRVPTLEEELNQQPSELKKSDDPLPIDFSVSELDDFSSSFADSLLDFDCIRDWIEEAPVLDMSDSNPHSEEVDSVKMMEVKSVEGCLGIEKDGSCRETGFPDAFQEFGNLNTSVKMIEGNPVIGMVHVNPDSEKVDSVNIEVKAVEGCGMEKNGSCKETGSGEGFQKFGDLSSSIEEDIGKFTLDGGSEENGRKGLGITGANSSKSVEALSFTENGVKSDEKLVVHDGGQFERDGAVGINDGGVKSGAMVTVNGDDPKSKTDGDENDSTSDSGSPSSSCCKCDFATSPSDPACRSYLSIVGTQVIVDGVEKHNPLSDGSILWITESRSPLGVVDEIFGPVKNPYYMISN